MTSGRRRAPLLGLSPRARVLLPVFLVVLVGLSLWRLGFEARAPAVHEFAGPTMGTRYAVKIAAESLPPAAGARVREAIELELEQVDGLMSTWDPDSELSRFNRSASTEPFAVSPPTLEVFQVAREISELTEGAFDITVGPLVAAWGFGASERLPGSPLAEALAELRERVGYRQLSIDPDAGTLRKAHPDVECDLSAVAKGYGVDAVARALDELGYANYLVEVGGELRARGERSPGRVWRAAIERPDVEGRSIYAVFGLRDAALATSGDYRNYYERDGVRLSHLIDPRVGRPVAHALASVSVLHADAAHADALATGLGVLGPEEGFALAEARGLAVYFIIRESDGTLRARATSSFPAVQRLDEADGS